MQSGLTYLERVARGLTQISSASAKTLAGAMAEMQIIILDRSWSMEAPCGQETRLGAAKNATFALLDARQQLGADDTVAVVAFSGTADLVLRFTRARDRRAKIDRAIRSIGVGSDTNLAAPLLLAETIMPSEGCVHIALLSDGHGGDPTDVADRLKRRGAIIETIGVGNDPAEVDESILKATASVLDGKVLYRFIRDADEMAQYFGTQIANRLVKRSEP